MHPPPRESCASTCFTNPIATAQHPLGIVGSTTLILTLESGEW